MSNYSSSTRSWRVEKEEACYSSQKLQLSKYIKREDAIEQGYCFIKYPLRVAAISNGLIKFSPEFTANCPLIARLSEWLERVVKPLAEKTYNSPLVEINVIGAYSCRTVDNKPFADLSEHAFGNAVDIGGFSLANGKKINVLQAWKSPSPDGHFLHQIAYRACDYFSNVLTPASDKFHLDHIHVDLAKRKDPRCKAETRPLASSTNNH